MEIEIKRKTEKRASKSFIENFIKEVGETLGKKKMNNTKSKEEEIKERKKTEDINCRKEEQSKDNAKFKEKQNKNDKKLEEEKQQRNNVKLKDEKIKLTNDEELELEKRGFKFLQNFFTEELKDLSKGETYIVTDKYENDYEYNRYKIAQYKNHFEYKYITFKKDLPSNVKLRDIIRKKNNQYTYDDKATEYVRDALDKIKQEIINERNKNK